MDKKHKSTIHYICLNQIPMEHLIVDEQHAPFVALIRLNRPKELNALNTTLMQELRDTLQQLDRNDEVRVIVLAGNDQAFAAGADIKQMADKTAVDMLTMDQFSTWDQIRKTKKPLIAAVSGFCLGGGLELAMTCDMIIASETARFGQPEIKIGVMPGAGGTQRLTRAVGKVKAMEMVLTGRFISAEEALAAQLINKVVPVEMYLREALALARFHRCRRYPFASQKKRSTAPLKRTSMKAFSLNEKTSTCASVRKTRKKE
jgi:enoyl-CoA hydratase